MEKTADKKIDNILIPIFDKIKDKKIITLTIKSERIITKIIFDHLLLMYV